MKDLLVILTILVFVAVGPFLLRTIGRFIASPRRTLNGQALATPETTAASLRGKQG